MSVVFVNIPSLTWFLVSSNDFVHDSNTTETKFSPYSPFSPTCTCTYLYLYLVRSGSGDGKLPRGKMSRGNVLHPPEYPSKPTSSDHDAQFNMRSKDSKMSAPQADFRSKLSIGTINKTS